jgi:hypothetical protein
MNGTVIVNGMKYPFQIQIKPSTKEGTRIYRVQI